MFKLWNIDDVRQKVKVNLYMHVIQSDIFELRYAIWWNDYGGLKDGKIWVKGIDFSFSLSMFSKKDPNKIFAYSN